MSESRTPPPAPRASSWVAVVAGGVVGFAVGTLACLLGLALLGDRGFGSPVGPAIVFGGTIGAIAGAVVGPVVLWLGRTPPPR